VGYFDRMRPRRGAVQKAQGGSFEGILFGLPAADMDIVGGVSATATADQAQDLPTKMRSPKQISDPAMFMGVHKSDGTAERKPVRVFKGGAGRPDYAFAAVGGYLTVTKI